MSAYRVVTIVDEGWTKVAVVKPREDDPSVWGVVAWFATVYVALREAHRMEEEQVRLARAATEMAAPLRYNGATTSGPRDAQTPGGLTGPNKEVAAVETLP